MHQRGFSRAGFPVHVNGEGLLLLAGLKGFAERGHVAFAADEQRRPGWRGRFGGAHDDESVPQAASDFPSRRSRRRVRVGAREIRLTRTEFTLLKSLMKRNGNVATHAQLVREVWGRLQYQSALHLLHVTIANLRRKIEQNPMRPGLILTEAGIGYRVRVDA